MPVFPHNDLLFIHIPKNAGKSIEKALFPKHMRADAGNRSTANAVARGLLRRTANTTAREFLHGTVDIALASQHVTLAEVQLLGLVPESQLKRMTKFCVIRNPYDRMISTLKNMDRTLVLEPKEIEAALERWLEVESCDHNLLAHRRPQSQYVRSMVPDQQMDVILRYESLETDFQTFCKRVGVRDVALPWIGKSRKTDYRVLLSEAARRMIEQNFSEDFDCFEYRF